MNERRDLAMAYTSPSGYPVSLPKGGSANASGQVTVPMIYRGQTRWGTFAGDCTVAQVKAWADSLLAGIDADLAWQALGESLMGEAV